MPFQGLFESLWSSGARPWVPDDTRRWPRRRIQNEPDPEFTGPLGGSWVVISMVTSRVRSRVTVVKTTLLTIHEPPSRAARP